MKIGIVTVWADCGAGHVSRQFRDVLAREHEVFIYARGTYASGQADPFWGTDDVTWDPGASTLTGVDAHAYRRWLEVSGVEIVIFNEQRRWGVVVETRKIGVRVGAYIDYYTSDTLDLFHLYDFLVCNTRRHHGVFGQWHPEAWYVPWGTDCELFSPGSRWGRALDEIRFVHSAGLGGPNDRKGTGRLLEAFGGVHGPSRLVLHSQLGLGALPRDWQERIASDQRVEFVFGSYKPPGPYHAGDVYVYPSRLEGIGLTVVESLACGVPVIASGAPPMNEFVVSGTGTLVSVEEPVARSDGYYWPELPCSVADLRLAMQRYVDEPWRVLSEQQMARRHAVANLDWSKNARILLRNLQKVVRNQGTPGKDIQDIERRALAVDREVEPTPAELLVRASKAAAVWARRRASSALRALRDRRASG